MRISILLLLLGCWTLPRLIAQDVLIQQDGQEIEASVQRVTERAVYYRLWEQPEGPDLVLDRRDLVLIRYADGRVEIMEEDYYGPDEPEPAKPSAPEAAAEARLHSLTAEVLSYLTGHLGLNYAYRLTPRWFLSADLGIVGFGQAVRPGFRREQVFSGGAILQAKSNEGGGFIRLGPAFKVSNSNHSFQGWYLQPEVSYSLLHITGEAYQRNGQPNDYDYRYRFAGHSIGAFMGGGYKLILADILLLDMNMGLGYVGGWDNITVRGVAPVQQPLPSFELPYFRYSHTQLTRQGGLAFTMGLAAGFVF